MNLKQIQVLSLRNTDINGAVYRCCGDEQMYTSCLKTFLNDRTIYELTESIELKDWDNAFTAAHALKGLAGNMGFVPLMHTTGQLLVLIRGGHIKDAKECVEEVKSCYRDITDAIRQFMLYQAY